MTGDEMKIEKLCTNCHRTYPTKYFIASSPKCRRCRRNANGYELWLLRQLELKRCSDCHLIKPFEQFHVASGRYGGEICGVCKKCKINRASQWLKDNPDKSRENTKRWYQNKKGKIR